MNDASTGNWRQPYASEATTADYSKSGSALRGGATRGGPRPHWEFYEKKIAC